MRYVDGFVLPVPRRHLAAYRRIARRAGRVWRDHGALEYRECVGDDLKAKELVPFPKSVKAKGARRWCCRGSCSSRARIATASTPR